MPYLRLTPLNPASTVLDFRENDGVGSSTRGSVTAAAWSPDGSCLVGNWSGSHVYGFEGVDGIKSEDGRGGFAGQWKWTEWAGDRKQKHAEAERKRKSASEGSQEKEPKSPRIVSPDRSAGSDDEMLESELPDLVVPRDLDDAEMRNVESEVVGEGVAMKAAEALGLETASEDENLSDAEEPDSDSDDEGDSDSESTPSDHEPHPTRPPRNPTGPFSHIPSIDTFDRIYRGAINIQTIKDVSFLSNTLVACGSDDGNLFLFNRNTSVPVQILRGDGNVVNVAVGHPRGEAVAVSGIDRTVKVFEPVWGGPRSRRAEAEDREDGVREESRSGYDDEDEEDEGPWGLGYRTQIPKLPSLVSPLPSSIYFKDQEDEGKAFPRSWSLLEHKEMLLAENERRRAGGGGGGGAVRVSRGMLLRLLGRLRERAEEAGVTVEDGEEDEEEGEGECQVQ